MKLKTILRTLHSKTYSIQKVVLKRKYIALETHLEGFPGGAVVKNPPAKAGDTGSIPGPGRSHMLRSN